MVSRRTLLAMIGGTTAVAGCLSGTADRSASAADGPLEADDPTAPEPATDDGSTAGSDVDRTDPEPTAWRFYEALLGGETEALNGLIHPESPGYPVVDADLPPARFTEFETVRIAETAAVSVQDRVVQQLYPNVTRTSRTRKAMGAERMQYVHTRFYITRPDDEGIYEADTVDYLVRDDDRWYVRYEGR